MLDFSCTCASLVEVPGQVAQATTKISNDVEELEVGAAFCLRLFVSSLLPVISAVLQRLYV
jgi:hypothetical protein